MRSKRHGPVAPEVIMARVTGRSESELAFKDRLVQNWRHGTTYVSHAYAWPAAKLRY